MLFRVEVIGIRTTTLNQKNMQLKDDGGSKRTEDGRFQNDTQLAISKTVEQLKKLLGLKVHKAN